MAKFASQVRGSAHELAIHDHAGANALGDGNYDEISQAFGGTSVPQLRQGAGISRIFQLDGQTGCLLESGLQFEVRPAQVRSKGQAMGKRIDTSRHANANAFIEQVWVSGHQIAKAACQTFDERGRVRTGGHRALRLKSGVDIGEAEKRGLRLNIHAENSGSLSVEVQESRFAPPGQLAPGAFGDPAFANELLGNGRNGAALQTGTASQAGAGDRLVAPKQVQNDAAIDVPRSRAAGHLKTAQINLSHEVVLVVGLG